MILILFVAKYKYIILKSINTLLFEIFIIKKLNNDNHRLIFIYLLHCMASIERSRHADQYQINTQYASGMLG